MTKEKLLLAQSINFKIESVEKDIKFIETILMSNLRISIWNAEYSTACFTSFTREEIKKILENKKDSLVKEKSLLESQFEQL